MFRTCPGDAIGSCIPPTGTTEKGEARAARVGVGIDMDRGYEAQEDATASHWPFQGLGAAYDRWGSCSSSLSLAIVHPGPLPPSSSNRQLTFPSVITLGIKSLAMARGSFLSPMCLSAVWTSSAHGSRRSSAFPSSYTSPLSVSVWVSNGTRGKQKKQVVESLPSQAPSCHDGSRWTP
jgi:hypothetical protein